MKKTNKFVLAVLLVVTLIIQCTTFPAYAAQPIPTDPQYNNTNSASNSASISNSGYLSITNRYTGKTNVTTGATIETYIEKHVTGTTWYRVNIG